MDILCQVRGYANVFDEFSVRLDSIEPLRERIRPGAFLLLRHPITANVAHCSAPIATTWDRSLLLWMDVHGVACEIDLACTPEGRGTRDLVASGYCAMSFGLITLRSNYFRDENGVPCREITRCDLDHVSIVDAGAFPSSCCWLSDMPSDRMTPRIRAASIHWNFGRIARDQKRAEDRATRAAKAAPARRRPRGKPEPILLCGMDPAEYMRLHGLHF